MLRLVVLLAMLAVSSVHAQLQQNWAAWCTPPLVDIAAWDTATDLPAGVQGPAGTILADGRIMIAGGAKNIVGATADVTFGTISGLTITWVAGTNLPAVRYAPTANTLADGRVLVIGGETTPSNAAQTTTRFATISGNTITWNTGTALPAARSRHTANLLSDGRILVMGGSTNGSNAQTTTYFGTISGTTITWNTGTALPAARRDHNTTILQDGRVLVTGGNDGSAAQSTSWLGTISGTTITWVTSTALPAVRLNHATSLINDGRVLVTGGDDGSTEVLTSWFGTVVSDTISWVVTTNLTASRRDHVSLLLNDGRVLLTAGIRGANYLTNSRVTQWGGGGC